MQNVLANKAHRLMSSAVDPYQFTQPQLIIAFKDQSQEGRSLVKCMEALLERLGRSPHRIPSVHVWQNVTPVRSIDYSAQGATAIKTGYPGSHGNGRSTERPRAARDQRTSQAGDERRNIVVARKSRRESKAILDRATGRQEPSAKGKGKSRAMEDPSQTKVEL